MYRFIPAYYLGVEAPATFPSVGDLQAIVTELKGRPRHGFRGQISFKDYTESGARRSHIFSGVRELEGVLAALNWNPATITRITFYSHGYYLINSEFSKDATAGKPPRKLRMGSALPALAPTVEAAPIPATNGSTRPGAPTPATHHL